MSILENGLPAGFFTRWRAVATGLGIAGAVIVASNIYSTVNYYVSEPKTAPACYGTQQVAGKQVIPNRGTRDRNGHSVDDRLASLNVDQITLAQRICTAQSCPSQAWKEYRSAMFWYLSSRLQHMSNLYRAYGDAGLTRAREIYREPFDQNVVEGLRQRFAAGVFRLNDFRQNRAAVTILVLRGSEALRPCGAGDVAEGD
jgi:hypothetical protein